MLIEELLLATKGRVLLCIEASVSAGAAADAHLQGQATSARSACDVDEFWYHRTEEHARAWDRLRIVNAVRKESSKLRIVGIDCQYPWQSVDFLTRWSADNGADAPFLASEFPCVSQKDVIDLLLYPDTPSGDVAECIWKLKFFERRLVTHPRADFLLLAHTRALRQGAIVNAISDFDKYAATRDLHMAESVRAAMDEFAPELTIVWGHVTHTLRGPLAPLRPSLGQYLQAEPKLDGEIFSVVLCATGGSTNVVAFKPGRLPASLRDLTLMTDAVGVRALPIVATPNSLGGRPLFQPEQKITTVANYGVSPVALMMIGWTGEEPHILMDHRHVGITVLGTHCDLVVSIGHETPTRPFPEAIELVNARINRGREILDSPSDGEQ